jgi:putative transposase
MKNVSGSQVVTSAEVSELPLPAEIQEALGELVGAARDGLLALSVGVGLRVVHELMEAEVTEIVGPKGRHDPDRSATRHGHEDGSMTLGGRRVPVSRPRARTLDGAELPVATYRYFADRDPLQRAVMDRMLAGVSTRKFARVGESVGEEVERKASATRKSTVSEMFIEKTCTALEELMARRLDDVRLAVMMLADLVDRDLDPSQAILFVLDGGKALRRAIKDVFGEHALNVCVKTSPGPAASPARNRQGTSIC